MTGTVNNVVRKFLRALQVRFIEALRLLLFINTHIGLPFELEDDAAQCVEGERAVSGNQVYARLAVRRAYISSDYSGERRATNDGQGCDRRWLRRQKHVLCSNRRRILSLSGPRHF